MAIAVIHGTDTFCVIFSLCEYCCVWISDPTYAQENSHEALTKSLQYFT
jgi:hypothetical protein